MDNLGDPVRGMTRLGFRHSWQAFFRVEIKRSREMWTCSFITQKILQYCGCLERRDYCAHSRESGEEHPQRHVHAVEPFLINLAEREGFEPSMFSLSSIAYKAIMSRSCLIVPVIYEHRSTRQVFELREVGWVNIECRFTPGALSPSRRA